MDAPEFEDWYADAYGPLVRAFVTIAGDTEVASDVVAEAFSRAYERWDRIASSANPTGWTYRVALNLLRRRHRRAAIEARFLKRVRVTMWAPDAPTPELWRAVAQLPARQREAIALRYVADLSERQVAEAMGVAEGTASATLAGARRQLAATLADLEELRWT